MAETNALFPAFDPTVALNAGKGIQAVPSALSNPQTLNSLIGAASALQTMRAKQAIGQAAQQSVDPTTGQMDQTKFNALIAGNPQASYDAQNAIDQAQRMRTTQLTNAQTQVDAYRRAAGTLVDKNGNFDAGDVYEVTKPLIDAGVVSPQQAAGEIKTFNELQTPQARAQWASSHLNQATTAQEQINNQLGIPSLTNQGKQLTPTLSSPEIGVQTGPQAGQPLPLTTSPAQGASPVAGPPNAQGAPTTMTLDQYGALQAARQAAAQNPPGGVFGTGRYPTAPAATGAPAAPGGIPGAAPAAPPTLGSPAAALALPQGMPVGLPPGQVPAETAAGAGSGAALADAHNLARDYQSRMYPLQTALEKLQALGTTGTGPGTETAHDIMSFLQSAGVPGIDSTKVADFDESRKYLTRYAMTQGGPHSDMQLATALTSNASTSISNLGAQDVVKATIGLERMRQAMTTSFDKTGLPAQDFNKYAAQWNSTADPRAFAIDLMPDPGKMIGALKPSERANFASSLREAIREGLVPAPAGSSNAAQP